MSVSDAYLHGAVSRLIDALNEHDGKAAGVVLQEMFDLGYPAEADALATTILHIGYRGRSQR